MIWTGEAAGREFFGTGQQQCAAAVRPFIYLLWYRVRSKVLRVKDGWGDGEESAHGSLVRQHHLIWINPPAGCCNYCDRGVAVMGRYGGKENESTRTVKHPVAAMVTREEKGVSGRTSNGDGTTLDITYPSGSCTRTHIQLFTMF